MKRPDTALMEVAAVTLSAGEQRTLSWIADELAASDPKLASMLEVFNRLMSDEEMPARQRAGGSRQREPDHSRRSGGRAWHRRGRRGTVTAWHAMITGTLITAVLVTVAIVLGHTGPGNAGRRYCAQSWPAGPLFPSISCHESARAVNSGRP